MYNAFLFCQTGPPLKQSPGTHYIPGLCIMFLLGRRPSPEGKPEHVQKENTFSDRPKPPYHAEPSDFQGIRFSFSSPLFEASRFLSYGAETLAEL